MPQRRMYQQQIWRLLSFVSATLVRGILLKLLAAANTQVCLLQTELAAERQKRKESEAIISDI